MTRLEYERRHRKLSQTKVAAAADLHQGDISQIERGSLIPNAKHLQQLADVFNLLPADLLKEVIIAQDSKEL